MMLVTKIVLIGITVAVKIMKKFKKLVVIIVMTIRIEIIMRKIMTITVKQQPNTR